MKRRKGFTLVELLVTITILGMLAVVGVAQFGTAQKKSRDVRRKGDLDSVYKAILAYYADYGRYPASSAGGGNIVVGGNPLLWDGQAEFKQDSYLYMKALPKPVTTAASYCYKAATGGTSFGLFVQLETTTDKECDRDTVAPGLGVADTLPFLCGGISTYCYQRLSPNLKIGDTIP